jgi:hypothetical protein
MTTGIPTTFPRLSKAMSRVAGTSVHGLPCPCRRDWPFCVLRDRDCGSLDTNGGTQLKKSRIHNSVTASAKQTRDIFCEFFHSPAGSVPWQMEALGGVQ